MALFKLIHLLSVMAWIGGIFFLFMVLRDSSNKALPPSNRLKLWQNVLQRFFNWVWAANFLLLVSGLFLIYRAGGVGQAPDYVQLMLLLGVLMLLTYCYLFFFPFVYFSLAVSSHDWLQAEFQLKHIRIAAMFNFLLGIATITLVVFQR